LIGRERITSWTKPVRALAARLDWRARRGATAVAVEGQGP